MIPIPEKCENISEVTSFCDCISSEEEVDGAVKAFCHRAEEKSGSVTSYDLADLEAALTDPEDVVSDEGCCEC